MLFSLYHFYLQPSLFRSVLHTQRVPSENVFAKRQTAYPFFNHSALYCSLQNDSQTLNETVQTNVSSRARSNTICIFVLLRSLHMYECISWFHFQRQRSSAFVRVTPNTTAPNVTTSRNIDNYMLLRDLLLLLLLLLQPSTTATSITVSAAYC